MIKTNIFLVHGPLVLAVVKRLLETDPSMRESNNYCFIFLKDKLEIKLPHCDTFSYATSGVSHYLKAQLSFKKKIKNIENEYGSYDVFIANPFHFSTNYSLFSSNRDQAFLLEEGLANYYNAQIRRTDKYKMIIKRAFGFITGLTFTPYSGHITAYESIDYTSIYVFNENLLVTNPGHINILPGFDYNESSNNLKSYKSIVFLDQDIENILSKDDAEKARKSLYAYLSTNQPDKIFYKKHPSQPYSNFDDLKQRFPNAIFIDNLLPIEMLIEEIHPNEVISFISSALITISDSHKFIRCTSVGYNLFDRISGKVFNDLFLSRHIHIVKV